MNSSVCYFSINDEIIFTLMQIPQPMHSVSEIHAILHSDVTSMHSFPGEKEH